MQRAHRPGLFRRHAGARRLRAPPSPGRKRAGRRRRGRRCRRQTRLWDGAELGDRLDRLRQRMPRRRRRAAAQEDPDAGLEQVVGDVAVDRLMRVGDAGGRIGGDELAPVDMAGNRPAALERRGEDGVAALVAHRHRDEIHLLAQRHRLRPVVEQGADLVRRQVAAGGFQLAARWPARCWAR